MISETEETAVRQAALFRLPAVGLIDFARDAAFIAATSKEGGHRDRPSEGSTGVREALRRFATCYPGPAMRYRMSIAFARSAKPAIPFERAAEARLHVDRALATFSGRSA
jgi:hypothetical protein